MNDETESAESKSWLDRLSHVLLREPQDREQLVNLLRDAEQRELLDADALSMIEGVLQVSELQVRDIMIPRTQMVALESDKSLDDILPVVIQSGHSRFPVIGSDRDEVIGILHAKELLKYSSDREEAFEIRDIIRPPLIVPESKHLNVLLKEFRLNRNHMAIVVDEYGALSGFVTIEDIIEQIVGEIADEFDVDEEAYIKKHSETQFIVKALTPIDTFNEYFDTHFDDEEFDTIGGLVISYFGHMPERGEAVKINHFQFKILRADNRRVHLLEMKRVTG